MFLNFQLLKTSRSGRCRLVLLLALAIFPAVGPARLKAQGDVDFDSIFQAPAPAGHFSGTPPLPPSAVDPFALPPAGSIPLGSASPPLTSPAASAAEPLDDPFGTPPPASRQVRQLAPAAPTVQPPAVPTVTSPQAPAAPSVTSPAVTSPAVSPEARQTMDAARRAELRALFPDMLPPADQSVSALTSPAGPAQVVPAQVVPAQAGPAQVVPAQVVPVQAAPEKPAEDGPAIGRAGSLLTQEYYGQAQILPPLDLPPPARLEEAAAPASEPKAEARVPAPPAAKAKAAPKAKASKGSQGGRAPAPALARGSLALVNETGDPQVGAVYQSALSRLGYTILSGPAGQQARPEQARPEQARPEQARPETVIYYRPGAQARAQAVSRDLPGRKTLAEAQSGATADIVVVLR